eukprot:1136471-Pelagomonas_calceolata.AAC.10
MPWPCSRRRLGSCMALLHAGESSCWGLSLVVAACARRARKGPQAVSFGVRSTGTGTCGEGGIPASTEGFRG